MTALPVGKTKFTPPVVARYWGVNPDKVIAFIRSGELRAIDIAAKGRRSRYLIDRADIEAFEQARTVRPFAESATRRRREDSNVTQYF